MSEKKVQISRQEFAEILEYCVRIPLTEKSIKKMAKTIGFPLKNDEDFSRIHDELLHLGMWLIMLACEKIIKNKAKRNEYLDTFHHHIHGPGDEFAAWMTMIDEKYADYTKAVQTEYTLGPDWALARLINKNLFGTVKEDPIIQTSLGLHIISFTTHLEQLLKELTDEYALD